MRWDPHTLSQLLLLVSATILPHSKKHVCLQVIWNSKTADWEILVTVDPQGMTGVDFYKRVNGHYFWGVEHAALHSCQS